jgi:hypothetical protein
MKKIKLTRGYEAIVDDEDYEHLNQFKWAAQPKGDGSIYAYRMSRRTYSFEKRHNIRMHRDIVNCPENKVVDHINHNTLDNRKVNLRISSHTENMRNRKLQKNNKLGTPGISFVPVNTNNPWRVTIRIGEKWPHYVGSYETKELAEQAYKDASIQYHGKFSPYAL